MNGPILRTTMNAYPHQSCTPRRPSLCWRRLSALVVLLAGVARAHAGEADVRSSNGMGGGRWSDPQTWHGGVVPGVSNRVVISGADTVHFDVPRDGRPHCAGLAVDPSGVLSFRMDGGTNVLVVNGPVTVYGTIRADATRDPGSQAGLELVAETLQDRTVNLLRGGGLLLYGAPAGAGGGGVPNLTLAAAPGSDASGGRVVAEGEAMIDLQRVAIAAVSVQASNLDNTGYKPNQRLNIIACHFTNGAAVRLAYCDTAVVRDNVFRIGAQPVRVTSAITLARGSLSACRGNLIDGYNQAINFAHEVDVSLLDNRFFNQQVAIAGTHGRNCMIKGNAISNAVGGVELAHSSGVVEDLRVAAARKNGVVLRQSALQLTDAVFEALAPDAVPLLLDSSSVTLLNANLDSKAIRLTGKRPAEGFWVQAMNYLVVRLTGKVPPRSIVQVATAAVSGGVPKDGAADLNVRNSPADVGPSGWSPLPGTMRPLIVRSWSIKGNEEVADPPFYDLTVRRFQADGAPDPKPLHAQVIEPRDAWFRPAPNAAVATLEIKLP